MWRALGQCDDDGSDNIIMSPESISLLLIFLGSGCSLDAAALVRTTIPSLVENTKQRELLRSNGAKDVGLKLTVQLR